MRSCQNVAEQLEEKVVGKSFLTLLEGSHYYDKDHFHSNGQRFLLKSTDLNVQLVHRKSILKRSVYIQNVQNIMLFSYILFSR